MTDDKDDDVIITEDNPENAESKEEENPERRDESTQDIINELEATRSSTHSRTSSFYLEVETEMDRRRALRLSNTLKRMRQTAGS